MDNNLGLIQVYTGNGKGKTTASLGLALRACGHGARVAMIQFMKQDTNYGEVQAARLLPGFKLVQVGRNDFVNLQNPEQIDIDLAQQGWQLAKSYILSGEWDILILDEINVAMASKLLDVQEVLAVLTGKRPPTELILTGRYAPPEILEAADLVTEMREIRHPYNQGTSARESIEF